MMESNYGGPIGNHLINSLPQRRQVYAIPTTDDHFKGHFYVWLEDDEVEFLTNMEDEDFIKNWLASLDLKFDDCQIQCTV